MNNIREHFQIYFTIIYLLFDYYFTQNEKKNTHKFHCVLPAMFACLLPSKLHSSQIMWIANFKILLMRSRHVQRRCADVIRVQINTPSNRKPNTKCRMHCNTKCTMHTLYIFCRWLRTEIYFGRDENNRRLWNVIKLRRVKRSRCGKRQERKKPLKNN